MGKMRFFRLTGAIAFVAVAWGCTDTDTSPQGTGASSGSGGSAGTTGGVGGTSPGSGGVGGGVSGGASGTSNAAGSGGMVGSGGATAGSGGSVAGATTGGGAGTPSAGTSGNAEAGTAGSGAGDGGAAGAGTAGAGAAGAPNTTDVTVQLGQTRQTMDGFGINNNWAPGMTDAEADAMFSTTTGLGLSLLRIGMNQNGEPFNGTDCWDDIEKASARGVTTFIGTLWSPPANCKTNNNVNDGGFLLESCYESWANTIAAFPAKVKQATGVDLYAMSPQNEVDFASCGFDEPCNGNYPTTLFTAAQYVAFAKVVGPKLKALNPPVKLIGPEASEWLHAWSNESASGSVPSNLPSSDPLDCGFPATNCAAGEGYDYGHALYADQTAWDLLDIFGVHQYDTQVAEPWPADVLEKKPVWQTEMSGVKWWPEQGPSSDIDNAVAVAGWIHNALTVGEASAWFWWWWKALGSTNEGLLLSDGSDTKRRYALGNYSRFIRPGYVRVDVTGPIPTDIELTAFKGPDDTVVVVAINQSDASVTVPITIAGGMVPAMLTPWVTSAADNLVSKSAVTVTGGTFSAELPGKTVTTYLGN